MHSAALSTEIEALRGWPVELMELLRQRDHAIELRDAEIAALKASNEELARKLALVKQRLWVKKSERFVPPEQATLPFVLPVPPEPEPPKTLPESSERPLEKEVLLQSPRPKRQRTTTKLRENLPRRAVRSKVPADARCERCGGALRPMGETTSHRFEWIPGHFEDLEISREKCACPSCPSEGVMVAVEPPFALPRAECGNGLLARVIVDKYSDMIPLNRQVKRMAREGVEFKTSTLSGWVLAAADLLRVVVNATHSRLMGRPWLQIDDTGYPVQDGLDGKLRRGRLWTYGDGQECVFRFTDTKAGKEPLGFLSDYQGDVLLADVGSEFNLVTRNQGLVRAGCWSHLRRYFFDARAYHPREATLALTTIRDLFEIERGLVGAEPEIRRTVRERDTKPLVDDFGRWVHELAKIVRPKSLLGGAVGYAVRNWPMFTVFLKHPDLPMHNNLAELQLRQPVIGRKNYLFAGSEGAAQAAATLYSLVVSCMLQAIDPWVYLYDVLNRLPDHPAKRVHELTPLGWRLAREN